MKAITLAALVIFAACQILDGGLTAYGLHHGAQEGNPVAVWLFSMLGPSCTILAAKGAVIALCVGLYRMRHRIARNPARIAVVGALAVGYVIVVVNNLWVLV